MDWMGDVWAAILDQIFTCGGCANSIALIQNNYVVVKDLGNNYVVSGLFVCLGVLAIVHWR